jgi:hypothetical protein
MAEGKPGKCLLMPALKSKLFPAEDCQSKTLFSAHLRRFAATAAALFRFPRGNLNSIARLK